MESFQTTIGTVKLLDNGIVHVHLVCSHFTKELLEMHYNELARRLAVRRYPFLYTFERPTSLRMDPDARVFNNRELTQWTDCLAAIAPNGLLRIFTKWYIKIANFEFPAEVFVEKEAAQNWIRFQFPKLLLEKQAWLSSKAS